MTKTQSAPVGGVDLGLFDTVAACNKGVEIELLHPRTLEPTGAFVTLLGRDSDVFRNALKRKVDAEKARLVLARKRGVDPEVKSADEEEAEGVDLLTKCVVGWRGLYENGEEFPYTPDNARALLMRSPEIRRQIDKAVADLANFIKG